MTESNKRFPNESDAYRKAREELLKHEAQLRTLTEKTAALRRQLPLGGSLKENYRFQDAQNDAAPVALSELFARDKNTLILYSFMFAPDDDAPCPMCSAMLDSLDGAARHVAEQINLAVVAKAPAARLRAFAQKRGWKQLRLLSSSENSYNQDYLGESPQGDQWPMLNIFVRKDEEIYHSWSSELFFAKNEAADARHVDAIWPLWNLFDLTPQGRSQKWFPQHDYSTTR